MTTASLLSKATSNNNDDRMTSLADTWSIKAKDLTEDAFRPFGQVCRAQVDGKLFDHDDAQLQLEEGGTPRFYIMRLSRRNGLAAVDRITRHVRCTQCLGSLQGKEWFMAVAPANKEPCRDNIEAFRIPGDRFIKLETGTWHAGPFFEKDETIDFYNLEMKDTNVVDHDTRDLKETCGATFQIIDRPEG